MKLSVCMITYNHEKYIAQAVESALMQKTDFDYEIVIGEDCSKDNTRQILIEYQLKYPQKIKLLLNDENIGMNQNFMQTLKTCRGEYIAILDGDDYWTSPQKLQMQVDYLEKNCDLTICFHKVKILKNGKLINDYITKVPAEETTIIDLANSNYIHTVSCVFKNNLFGEFPDWFKLCPVADYVVHLLNAQYGKIKYIDKEMAVYRIHEGGTWINKNRRDMLEGWIVMLENLIDYFRNNTELQERLINSHAKRCIKLSNIYLQEKEQVKSHEILKRSAKYGSEYLINNCIRLENKFIKLSHLWFYRLYSFVLNKMKKFNI